MPIYIPIVSNPKTEKGIGIVGGLTEDVEKVGATYYHRWGNGNLDDSRFIPMYFFGNETFLPADYNKYIILFNEPENPNQTNLPPYIACQRYSILKNSYPYAKFIVGNCGLWGNAWIRSFNYYINEEGLPRPAGWGVHGYIEPNIYYENVIYYWESVKQEIVEEGEEFWITEYADVYGEETESLVDWAILNSNKHFIFTNRITDENVWWYPSNWPRPPVLQLIDNNGNLTEIGELYKSK